MIAYIIRRCLYAIPTLIGVNILVFLLFFILNTPDDMAKAHLGEKRVTPEAIDNWKEEHSLNLPMFYNRGWTKVDGMDGMNDKKTDFELAAKGEYRIIIKAPELTKKLKEKLKRKVSISFADKDGIEISPKLNLDNICPKYEHETIINFTNNSEKNTLSCLFYLNEKSAKHQFKIEYKKSIGFMASITDTIFVKRSLKMLFFQYGKSDEGQVIAEEIGERMLPSLVITIPALLIGAFINIIFAMLLAINRGNQIDNSGTILCVVLMSISALFFIIGGQWFFGSVLKLVPVSGFDMDSYSIRFLILPVSIIVMAGMGASTRFYRTLFLEEINKQYIKTARAKGLAESKVMFVHLLKNALIPILTGLVVQLPFLFVGSLLIENFFAIPGMGSFTVQAIKAQDFASVQAMVSLGSFMYIIGLLLTDISYVWADPRVKLGDGK